MMEYDESFSPYHVPVIVLEFTYRILDSNHQYMQLLLWRKSN